MKSNDPNVKVVSFTKLAFPKLARYAARYRVVADYGNAGARSGCSSTYLLGQGRRRSRSSSRAYADRAAADGAERRLAQLLVSRIVA